MGQDEKNETSSADASAPDLKKASVTLAISENRLLVTVDEYTPESLGGTALEESDLTEALADIQVSRAPEPDAWDNISDAINRGESPHGIVVVRGIPPENGVDGRLSFRIRTALGVGKLSNNDRIDFHERGVVESVQRGQLLATVSPPTDGKPGVDVTGRPIPANPGRKPIFKADKNVDTSADGTCFYAAVDGMVQYVHSVLSVSEVFQINRDVDFGTGNIHMKSGSVQIRGLLKNGFVVEAAGNIVVETIEGGQAVAGGDIEVRGGIVGGKAIARGAVFARYAINSTITAEGDVIIANNIQNCEVTAGDKIITTAGKGVIRGGILRCGLRLEVLELGSRSDAETKIFVGLRGEDENALYKEKSELEESIFQIRIFLGQKDTDLEKPPSEIDPATAKVQATLVDLERRVAEIASLLEALRKTRRGISEAEIVVAKVVHPGVTVSIAGRSYQVEEMLERCKFKYDPESDSVVALPL